MTLIVLVVVLTAAGLTLWHVRSGGTSAHATGTTTVPQYPTAPLTGLADPTGQSVTRPALTVKIENTPEAMPQYGLDQADVVYEEIVNGGITRLAAIFNSQAPVKVGPVRSVRPTDQQIVDPLGGIFAFSGGAPYAMASIAQAPVKLIDESSAGTAMFRDPTRQAPHNLYASANLLLAMGGTPVPPPALFTYRGVNEKVKGTVVSRFVVQFPSIYATSWDWNPATLSWGRSIFGKPLVTGTGVQVSPKNVIVMWVNYVNGVGTFTSYADLQGSGTAAVFTDGKEVSGTWSRGPAKSDLIAYRNASGATIALTPGQTWVELLNVGALVNVTP